MILYRTVSGQAVGNNRENLLHGFGRFVHIFSVGSFLKFRTKEWQRMHLA